MSKVKKVLVVNNHPNFASNRTQMIIDSFEKAGYDVVCESVESEAYKGMEFDFVVFDELSEDKEHELSSRN